MQKQDDAEEAAWILHPQQRDSDEGYLRHAVARQIAIHRKAYHEARQRDTLLLRQQNAALLADVQRKRSLSLSLPVARTALLHNAHPHPATRFGIARSSSTLGGKHSLRLLVMSPEKHVPRYKAWSYLVHNELAMEVGRKLFYTDSHGETIPASDSDEDTKGDASLEGIYRERDLFIIAETLKAVGASQDVLDLLAHGLGLSLPAVSSAVQELYEAASGIKKSKPTSLVGTYNETFCRSCRVFKCLIHRHPAAKSVKTPAVLWEADHQTPCGDLCWLVTGTVPRTAKPTKQKAGTPECTGKPSAATPGPHPRGLYQGFSHSIVQRQHKLRQACKGKANSPLFRAGKNVVTSCDPRKLSAEVLEALISSWPVHEQEQLQQGLAFFGPDACRLARYVNTRTCSEIAEILGPELQSGRCRAESEDAADRPVSRRKRHPNRAPQARKVVQKRAQHTDALWEQYTPCSCPGGCGDDCPCLENAHFCQKFCGCGPSCPHFFPGCNCSGRCRTKICPCSAAGFECDPDVCKSCCSLVVGKPPPPGIEICQNMRLRLRQHKRVAMGLSSIAGWGAYLLEPALKNELIGEYTGELVDQDEAERRGKVYDRDDNSYLFNLNLSWVIDARNRGNKLRFANHSLEPNCSAKILMVDGDHRVGIFALKDISAGQELLYNYLYTQDQAPAWAREGTSYNRRHL